MGQNEEQYSTIHKREDDVSSMEGAYCLIDPRAAIWGEEPGKGPHTRVDFPPQQRAGFTLCPFVKEFIKVGRRHVPRVKPYLSLRDMGEMVLAGLGVLRASHVVAPGLYCVGFPDEEAPVLAVPNRKMSFDVLRKELSGIDAWLLVFDATRKDSWKADERHLYSVPALVHAVRASRLHDVVSHRRVYVPQSVEHRLDADIVMGQSGFSLVYGPRRTKDWQGFFENGGVATVPMQETTFTLAERMVRIPRQLHALLRPLAVFAVVAFVLSGMGPDVFDFDAAWSRMLGVVWSAVAALAAGSVAVPLLLPVLPGGRLTYKGLGLGAVAACVTLPMLPESLSALDVVALGALIVSASSWLARDFARLTPIGAAMGPVTVCRRPLLGQCIGGAVWAVLWGASRFLG